MIRLGYTMKMVEMATGSKSPEARPGPAFDFNALQRYNVELIDINSKERIKATTYPEQD